MSKHVCKRWGQGLKVLSRSAGIRLCDNSKKSKWGYKVNFVECQECEAGIRATKKGILPDNFTILKEEAGKNETD